MWKLNAFLRGEKQTNEFFKIGSLIWTVTTVQQDCNAPQRIRQNCSSEPPLFMGPLLVVSRTPYRLLIPFDLIACLQGKHD